MGKPKGILTSIFAWAFRLVIALVLLASPILSLCFSEVHLSSDDSTKYVNLPMDWRYIWTSDIRTTAKPRNNVEIETYQMLQSLRNAVFESAQWLRDRIPLLSKSSLYEEPIQVIVKDHLEASDGIINGLYIIGTLLGFVGAGELYLILGVILIFKGLSAINLPLAGQGLASIVLGLLFPVLLILLPVSWLALLFQEGTTEYYITYLLCSIGTGVLPIVTYGLMAVVATALDAIPKVIRGPIVGAVLGTVAGVILGGQTNAVIYGVIGAVSGALVGAILAGEGVQKSLDAIATLLLGGLRGALRTVTENVLRGTIQGMIAGMIIGAIRSAIQGETGGEAILDVIMSAFWNAIEGIPQGVVGGAVVGAFWGMAQAIRAIRRGIEMEKPS